MRRKIWKIANCDKEKAAQFAEDFSINPFAAYLAVARGVDTAEKMNTFFNQQPMLSVDPMALPDMQLAVTRIQQAIANYERIAIYGDYDTDGVTATTILYLYLEACGANVIYSMPDRHEDGYGITPQSVSRLQQQDVSLIITVDNGISAYEAAEEAQKLGIDMVITDHHRVQFPLPTAVAVVDPHREDCDVPFRDYAGVGVAFKLICALEGEDSAEEMLEEFGDIVAIGTVGDIVPLTGENRVIVQRGLSQINAHSRVSVSALVEAVGAKPPIVSNSIGYRLSPRINAAGRMGSARLALELLLSEDTEAAASYAQQLNDVNTQRQATEAEILAQAQQQLRENPQWRYSPVLLVSGEGWHEGVIGIVAARLTEQYAKPSIVLAIDGEITKGSGRSYEGFSLYEAIKSASDCLMFYGGHHGAAGLTMQTDQIEAFRKKIDAYATAQEMPFPIQNIDCKLNAASIKPDLLKALDALQPFGAGNPQPLFGLYQMKLEQIVELSEGKYLRLRFSRKGSQVQVMHFSGGKKDFAYRPNDVVDLSVVLERNIYMGEERISIYLRDIKPASTKEDAVLHGIRQYEAFARGETLTPEAARAAMADRNLCAKLYRQIRDQEITTLDYEALCMQIGDDGSRYCAVCVAVAAMLELGVLQQDDAGHLSVPQMDGKLEIQDAPTIRRLQTFME